MSSTTSKVNQLSKNVELSNFSLSCNLFLKPIARVSVTVQIPVLHDTTGQAKSFTTWEIIEKLRQLCPGILAPPTTIKVSNTTYEFVRFLVELESKSDVKRVATSLDSQYVKLSGFPQNLRVRASEAPFDCPRRHDWESFFRDAQNMDETRPGERPDTIIISGLPVRWFSASNPCYQLMNNQKTSQLNANCFEDLINLPIEDKPQYCIVREAFEVFGKIREIDIPMLDPVQNPNYFEGLYDPNSVQFSSMFSSTVSEETNETDESGGFGKMGPDIIGIINSASQTPVLLNQATDSEQTKTTTLCPLTFSVYIQYMDYTGFSKAMEMLLGQKLVYAPKTQSTNQADSNEKLYYTAEVKINFDREKHLSKSSIHARQIKRSQFLLAAEKRRAEVKALIEAESERKRLLKDSELKAAERKKAEALAAEAEKEAKRAARAESKRKRAIDRCQHIKDELIRKKIDLEERRRIVAVRKIEGIRLMTFLLSSVQTRHDFVVESHKSYREKKLDSISSLEKHISPNRLSPNKKSKSSMVEISQTDDHTQSLPTSQSNADEDCPVADVNTVSLEQLLKKREEFLRNHLLNKRAELLRNQICRRTTQR